ncbi:hypothetical protein SDDV_ORF116 [Scale drop disease virus]|nr:hypothetical protein SDDV_ORF116 [Scale drop disease virus]
MERPIVRTTVDPIVWYKNLEVDSTLNPVFDINNSNISSYTFPPYINTSYEPINRRCVKPNVYDENDIPVYDKDGPKDDYPLGPRLQPEPAGATYAIDFSYPEQLSSSVTLKPDCIANRTKDEFVIIAYCTHYLWYLNNYITVLDNQMKRTFNEVFNKTLTDTFKPAAKNADDNMRQHNLTVFKENMQNYKSNILTFISSYKTYITEQYNQYVTEMNDVKEEFDTKLVDLQDVFKEYEDKLYNSVKTYIENNYNLYNINELSEGESEIITDIMNQYKVISADTNDEVNEFKQLMSVADQLTNIENAYNTLYNQYIKLNQIAVSTEHITERNSHQETFNVIKAKFEALKKKYTCYEDMSDVRSDVDQLITKIKQEQAMPPNPKGRYLAIIYDNNSSTLENVNHTDVEFTHYTFTFPTTIGSTYIFDIRLEHSYQYGYEQGISSYTGPFTAVDIFVMLNDSVQLFKNSYTNVLPQSFSNYFVWKNTTETGNVTISVKIKLKNHTRKQTFLYVKSYPSYNNYFSIIAV